MSTIEIRQFPCRSDNYGILIHDRSTGATAAIDAPDEDAVRKALRDAVLSIKFDGVSGPIACDAHGQCAKFKPAVYEFTNGDPKTFKIGVNPKKIWP